MSKAGDLDQSLKDLHLLTIIAETRSFTQSAARLGISKASVSVRIQDLERSAGVALVRRSTRSVVLTPAGQKLVEDMRSPLASIHRSFNEIRELAGVPRGLVRMTVPVALGRQHISPLIPEFLRNFPEIRLELDLNDRVAKLAQEGFDLAVRHSHAAPDACVAHLIRESRTLLFASEDYLSRRGCPAHPAELSRHQCILYPRAEGTQNWSFESRADRRRTERISVPVRGPFIANNSEVLRDAIIGGVGIGLLPDFSVQPAATTAMLEPILTEWRPVGFFGARIYVIRPWSPTVPRAVQCLVSYLRRNLFRGAGSAGDPGR